MEGNTSDMIRSNNIKMQIKSQPLFLGGGDE
jgi:hypothetical protein